MEGKTFFEQYRVCTKEDGSPQELGRNGPAVTYKAVHIRSGELAMVKLFPLLSVDPTAREQFEEQARAAKGLDHVNITKLHAFGIEDDHFVYVSEYPHGETVDAWVAAHGPMPPEAVLRIALQVVSALSAASFNGLKHRAIQPSNLGIVPGETAEGGWPFVKLMNFELAGLKLKSPDGHDADPFVALQFASPEQVEYGIVDFQSELYSLGATMCFLLTGVLHSRESRLQQLRRFPRPVRDLLAHMLRTKHEDRPHDRVAFEEEIRECLQRVERRQMFAQRFGIPFVPVTPRPPRPPRAWLPSRAVAFAALALAAVTVAAVLLPEPIGTILHSNRAEKPIGIPVGVPETSPAMVIQNAPATTDPGSSSPFPTHTTNPPASESTQPIANQPSLSFSPAVVADLNQPPPAAQPAPPSPAAAASLEASPLVVAEQEPSSSAPPADTVQPAEPAPPAEAPDPASTASDDLAPPQEPSTENASTDTTIVSKSASTSGSKTTSITSKGRGKANGLTSASKRRSPRINRRPRSAHAYPDHIYPRPGGSVRAQVVGTTPDGRVILRLPSGRTVFAAPRREEYPPMEYPEHRVHTIQTERRTILWPRLPFFRMFSPDEYGE